MKETKDRFGMLFLLDAIGLLLTTVVLLIIFSKLTGVLDTNVIVLSIFFYGIKVLLMGISDITGIGKKIWAGIIFVLISNMIILAINVLMAFGVQNMTLLISAGVDILMIVFVRLIWNAVFSKKKSQSDFTYEDTSVTVQYDNESEKEEEWMSSQIVEYAEKKHEDDNIMMDFVRSEESVIGEEPVVQVGTERLIPANEDNSEFSELFEQIDSLNFDRNNNKRDEESEIDKHSDVDLQAEERPSGAPNLDALNDFFGEVDNQKDRDEQQLFDHLEVYDDVNSENQNFIPDIAQEAVDTAKGQQITDEEYDIPAESANNKENIPSEIDELTQEMNRQFEVLQNRVDNLEQREADLKRREEALKQSSSVCCGPREVHLDNSDSEIIINEDDLELLKAYLKQHPEI